VKEPIDGYSVVDIEAPVLSQELQERKGFYLERMTRRRFVNTSVTTTAIS
jgi:hypothetical protein